MAVSQTDFLHQLTVQLPEMTPFITSIKGAMDPERPVARPVFAKHLKLLTMTCACQTCTNLDNVKLTTQQTSSHCVIGTLAAILTIGTMLACVTLDDSRLLPTDRGFAKLRNRITGTLHSKWMRKVDVAFPTVYHRIHQTTFDTTPGRNLECLVDVVIEKLQRVMGQYGTAEVSVFSPRKPIRGFDLSAVLSDAILVFGGH